MSMKSTVIGSVFAVALLVIGAATCLADIVNPADVSIVSNGYGTLFNFADYDVINAFNGSGLKLPLDANGQCAVWNDWTNCPTAYSNTANGRSMWQSYAAAGSGAAPDAGYYPSDAALVVDLGSTYNLTGLRMWSDNKGGETGRGVYQGNLAYSTDNVTWQTATSFTLTRALGDTSTVFGDSITKIGNSVRYVKFTDLTCFAGTDGRAADYGGGWNGVVSLSEVQFVTIPEPCSVVLLATGLLGLLAYAWRKRKS